MAYEAQVSVVRVAWRRVRRELALKLQGQNALRRAYIDPAQHRRLLWIHQGTPQVGDSLMDLAARVLLAGRVESVDLLTEAGLVPLYRADRVFAKAASQAGELRGPYDLILLHSASSRCVRAKVVHYRHVPFVHIQGLYTGPEFNRTLFGFYRLAQLLQCAPEPLRLEAKLRPVMWSSAQEEQSVDALHLPPGALVVALGGVRDWRTYSQWSQVLHGMVAVGFDGVVVLVGSDNALTMRDDVLAAGTGLEMIDQVGRLSLGQVHALMRRCALALCSDGGLLHVAHAAQLPVVALFAGPIDPSFRVTEANQTRCLYAPQRVDQIPPAAVVEAAMAAIAATQKDPSAHA
ncbi:MAG: hypothetical protein RLZZ618_4210 [Pseudomonadota bacterium]